MAASDAPGSPPGPRAVPGLADPDRHGDEDVEPGCVDFAVNVRPGPPDFLVAALRARIGGLGAYPARSDEERVRARAAALHGRPPGHVLPLAGAAEGFELIARLAPRHAALVVPSFTEPARLLRAAGVRVTETVLPQPWLLDPALIPADADLVVVGNPVNPTSVLHPAAAIESLRAPGRLVVVDEAFADLTYDPASGAVDTESLAALAHPDVIVVRSVTKTFGLAGLRAGYLLADPDVVGRLTAVRRHWPVGTLALTALAECLGPTGQRYVHDQARQVTGERDHLVRGLAGLGLTPAAPPAAPFVLVEVPDGLGLKERLRRRGFGVRSCANFTGLGSGHLRIAVRPAEQTDALVAALGRELEWRVLSGGYDGRPGPAGPVRQQQRKAPV